MCNFFACRQAINPPKHKLTMIVDTTGHQIKNNAECQCNTPGL
ncbi:16731_t:CDS:1, partial [Dentiscutata heterogama]